MTATTELLHDRYRLERRLGHGGMADVYRATDEATGQAVAVKLVRSADPEIARRFALEAQTLERLRHPGLVRLLDTGVADDQAFLVMELVEGPALADEIRAGRYTPERTARLGAALAEALAAVHAAGVVHRDVKPGNVLLDAEGRPRLADFGIARLADASVLTVAGTTMGTAAYMAPEQLEGRPVGPAADVFSLGVLLLECLVGRRLYEGTASEVVARRLAGPVPVPAGLPGPWRRLLGAMLDPAPGHRPRSREVAAALRGRAFAGAGDATTTLVSAAEATAPIVWPPAAPAGHRPGGRRRRFLVPALAAAAVVGVAVALAVTLGPAPGHPPAAATAATAGTTAAQRAAAVLIRQVGRDRSTGTVADAAGASLVADAERAAQDGVSDRTGAAAALAAAATTLGHGLDTGSVRPAAAPALEGDLDALAAALGVSAPPVTTTAPTTAAPATTAPTTAPATTPATAASKATPAKATPTTAAAPGPAAPAAPAAPATQPTAPTPGSGPAAGAGGPGTAPGGPAGGPGGH